MSAISNDQPVRTISYQQLEDLLRRIFLAHGTSPEVADVLAENCAGAQRDGSHSHGIFRMPGYISSLNSGWVDGKAVPLIEDVGAAFVRVDAGNGFAQPALAAASSLLIDKVRSAGIAVLAIRNSHHFAALWPDVEPFAEQGLVALSMVNSMTCVVPHGARQPLFGTNPIAFAAPRAGGEPVVFDLATSAIAHGDVQIAAREGRLLPAGMGVDREGRPTEDPRAILDGGALLPFGGHKGSALSMMVELLAAGLTGGNFSFEFDWSKHPGARTPWTGQLLIVIDPDKGSGQHFALRSEELVRQLHGAGQERLPGDRRYSERARSMAHGIDIAEADLERLQGLAGG
ncbi:MULTISPECIES: Ldh family oxidoreductase [Pseudomonas syringae group]|uniref:Delta(1)-pyrroline-2-carboxylate/Delta(1)-piperideine-2-carboxylate reductase n=3 Tax=Pseudomonas syringae group TaxID=136849 RepID=A0A0Q0CRE9_PSEA0|nr:MULTISPECIES: Ldh family oxidoreductase [Pseudomonas syringae group]EGH02383.1 malate/L-lactate family dehydrogenase [Pseudomonas amygdali pv. aesculi str. 0893_23]KPW13821.1 Malate/L-lactate family dehydrogenase [Pseudomonas amygdali pv. aesculi]KPX01718.1 Malate/L-lactate family dehydrogenase [Pseudomonas syringae pv. cerasicola]KPZ08514.1 Malate/L-lactate family dehydrogenase [Pseudomonas amygdali pv. ulmi]KWS29274.1 lactate dehydrogenase [Pseudomonas amygdali pv. ulmi]